MARKMTKQEIENSEPGNCVRCGKYESVGRDTGGFCCDCHNENYAQYKSNRKAQLAAMARCEINGCNRRGQWHVGNGDTVLVCGCHLKKMRNKIAGMGIIASLGSATASGKALAQFAN